ncbi:MAG: peptidylprolyl isomerase [Gammaproteobacteria bacterium]
MLKLTNAVHRHLLIAAFCLLLPVTTSAQSIVQVETSAGTFFIELFDEIAPITVSNFINYVITDRYDGTIIHRSEPGFVIQGGWLTIPEGSTTFNQLVVGPEIINEFNVSNTRGTVAMAKVDGNPDSATSQWFINLGDNSALDNSNGGFTVFGRILGNGMDVVDTIAGLQRAQLSGTNFLMPVINVEGQTVTRNNLVFTNMTLVSGEAQLPNYIDLATNEVRTKVNGGSAGVAELSLRILQTEPQIQVQVRTDNAAALSRIETGFATFNPANGELRIPELGVNGEVLFRNLVFTLDDAEQLLFTLQSFE